MERKLMELAIDIVQSQSSANKMSAEEIELALIRVYNVLHQMRQAEAEDRPMSISAGGATSATAGIPEGIDPRESIGADRVACLECGGEFRQLTANHLKTHQLTPREYKRKWGFPLKQPLAARNLTDQRSSSAKKRGLPQKLQKYLQDQRQRKNSSTVETGAENGGNSGSFGAGNRLNG